MKKRSLSKTMLLSCLIFAASLSLFIGAIGYFNYNEGIRGSTNEYAEGVINYILEGMDVEKVKEAIEKNERNDEIDRLEKICDKIKQTHDLEYIYIIKPLNLDKVNNMEYVLTGEPKEDRDKGFRVELGKLSDADYDPKVVKYYFDSMKNGGEFIFFTNTTSFGYMYTGMKAILDKNGEGIAIVATDINMDDISAIRRNYLILILISSAIITSIFILLLYNWLNRRVIKPIALIEKSSNDFVSLSHQGVGIDELIYKKPNIKTRDEIESLSNAVDTMTTDLKTYMHTVMKTESEKNRMAGELSAATQIQSSMLPCIFPPFPNDTRFEIFATMNPAKEVGGDFYDFFKLDDKHLAIVVADVSGKGVPAALFMVIGKTLIKDHSSSGRDLGDVFQEVNNLLCESNSEGLFITGYEAIINLETGHVRYVNAGHEMPFIYRKGKEWTAFEMKPGFVLAGMEGIKYKAGELTLEHGDKLFQYTDGVTEATNINNELYGMERLKKVLDANADKHPKELLPSIKDDIDSFVGEAPQFDDITMLGFEFK